MIKRAQGRNRFGMKNFKKRWFRLTNHEFTYHKTKGEGSPLQLASLFFSTCSFNSNMNSKQFYVNKKSFLLCGFFYPPGEGALCSIPIENILAVERLEEESFRMKNVSLPKFTTPNILPVVCIYCENRNSFPHNCFFFFFAFFQMFQVIQPERALYIQANNCVEARDWIDILTKVSQCNRKRLSTYHPSAYLNGHWLCCKMSADTAPGCTPCTG